MTTPTELPTVASALDEALDNALNDAPKSDDAPPDDDGPPAESAPQLEPGPGNDDAEPGEDVKQPDAPGADTEAADEQAGRPKKEKAADEQAGRPKKEKAADTDAEDDDETFRDALEPGRTRERFDSLLTRNRDLGERVTRLESAGRVFTEAIAATGATPEELSQVYSWLGRLKSPDVSSQLDAVQALGRYYNQLARAYGVAAGDYSPVDEFPDIKEKLDSAEITQDIANELAAKRKQEQVRERGAQVAQHQAREFEATQQMLQQAAQAATQLDTNWQQTDPDYLIKKPYLSRYADSITEQVKARALHPADAVKQYQDFYGHISQILLDANKRQGREESPLRSSGRSGTGKAFEATGATPAEAASKALDHAFDEIGASQ
jgi:hypothetical protein